MVKTVKVGDLELPVVESVLAEPTPPASGTGVYAVWAPEELAPKWILRVWRNSKGGISSMLDAITPVRRVIPVDRRVNGDGAVPSRARKEEAAETIRALLEATSGGRRKPGAGGATVYRIGAGAFPRAVLRSRTVSLKAYQTPPVTLSATNPASVDLVRSWIARTGTASAVGERASVGEKVSTQPTRPPRGGLPAIGTRLRKASRDGKSVECEIAADGVHYAGRVYGSLSAAGMAAAKDLGMACRAINGWAFWGVTR